jgi:hypothetical protein
MDKWAARRHFTGVLTHGAKATSSAILDHFILSSRRLAPEPRTTPTTPLMKLTLLEL